MVGTRFGLRLLWVPAIPVNWMRRENGGLLKITEYRYNVKTNSCRLRHVVPGEAIIIMLCGGEWK